MAHFVRATYEAWCCSCKIPATCRLDLGTVLISNGQISGANYEEFFDRQMKRLALPPLTTRLWPYTERTRWQKLS